VNLLFVVQRYGADIAGGAEHLVREYALRLTERGHHVEVLTSCAHSYTDWADVHPPGTSTDGGVTVHRCRVVAPRPNDLFGPLHQRVTAPRGDQGRWSPVVTTSWSRMIGPDLEGMDEWLLANCSRFDAVVFSGYLYSPSIRGLPLVAPLVPTVLQPVAHDEITLRLPILRELFDHAAGINFLTHEERALVDQRFRPTAVSRVFGAGVGTAPPGLDVAGERARFGLGDSDYLVCVGRIDPAKGMHELGGHFRAFRERHDIDLKLVFVGSEIHPLERHPDIVVTGFVDESTKWALISGSTILAQPSYFESFSLSLAEGWRCARPALVQGRNDVLRGQVRRADGGLTFTSFSEFDAGLDLLLGDPDLRTHFGISGQNYVEQYNWGNVLDNFESLLSDTRQAWNHRRSSQRDQR